MPSEPYRTSTPNDYLLLYDLLDKFNDRLNAQALRPFLADHLDFSPARRISIAEAHLDAIVPFQEIQAFKVITRLGLYDLGILFPFGNRVKTCRHKISESSVRDPLFIFA